MSTAPKPKRRWYQYGLRTLLLLIAAICCLLVGPTQRAREHGAVVDAVQRVGGRVLYDWQNPSMDFDPGVSSFGQMYYQFSGRTYFDLSEYGTPTQPPGPAWLRRWIGEDYFQSVTIINAGGCLPRDELSPDLITNEWLRTICRLTSLRWLDIDHATKITDDGIAQIESLTSLERLFADNAPITDRGLKHLAGLTRLEYLSVNSPGVTDEGLQSLCGLSRMKMLYLGDTRITDRGLRQLQGLKQLERLYLPGTKVSDKAAREFEKAVPGCNVIFVDPGIVG